MYALPYLAVTGALLLQDRQPFSYIRHTSVWCLLILSEFLNYYVYGFFFNECSLNFTLSLVCWKVISFTCRQYHTDQIKDIFNKIVFFKQNWHELDPTLTTAVSNDSGITHLSSPPLEIISSILPTLITSFLLIIWFKRISYSYSVYITWRTRRIHI